MEFCPVKIRVYPLQLAIMGQWSEIVHLFLSQIYQKNGSRSVMEVLKAKVELFSKFSASIFNPEDICLDGMNAIHLSAKFDPKSLQVSRLGFYVLLNNCIVIVKHKQAHGLDKIKAVLRITYSTQKACSWKGGWVDGWMDVKAILRIAYSNKKWPESIF